MIKPNHQQADRKGFAGFRLEGKGPKGCVIVEHMAGMRRISGARLIIRGNRGPSLVGWLVFEGEGWGRGWDGMG